MAVPEERQAILQDLEERKREVRIAVEELAQASARLWPDPRERIRNQPAAWLVGGFAVGILIGWSMR
jgi:hypothetical protein